MSSIFISYRREDVGGHAGRLCDRLNACLGRDRVFMDVEDIRPGQDFVQAIDDTMAKADCLLVLIGPRWLDSMARRADAGTDFVRHEILAGLRQDKTIIPVLVAGARMPATDDLPPDLAALGRRHAVEIRDDRFDDDVARLVTFLGDGAAGGPAAAGATTTRRRALVGVTALVLVLGGATAFVALRPAEIAIDGEWLAEMRDQRQRPFRIRLTLVRAGRALGGTVSYPTGDGVIQDGAIDGAALTFSTSHVPQFESSPAIIRYIGRLADDGLHLTATDEGGVATGIARPVERRP